MKAENMNSADVAFQLADKTLHAPAFIGSLFSGALAAVGSIVTGEGAALTAITVAASAVLGALFSNLPGIIKARAESKKVEVNLHDDGQSKYIDQIYRNQDREREAHEKQVKKLEAEILVLRNTKHEMLNESHVLTYWIHELRDVCREHNIIYPEHPLDTSKTFTDLIRKEDAAMRQIVDIAATVSQQIEP